MTQNLQFLTNDTRTQLFLSKPFPADTELPPPWGQTIKVGAAAAENDTSIILSRSLIEPVKAGTVLDFGDGKTATLSANALEGSKTLKVQPLPLGSALTGDETATTSGTEQTVTLSGAVTEGDETINVNTLTDWIEPGRRLTFDTSGVEVVVKLKAEKGATEIEIEAAPGDIGSGDTATVSNYSLMYSMNTADDSSSANAVQDRVYQIGVVTDQDTPSRTQQIQISGPYVIGDFAWRRIQDFRSKAGLKMFAILFEPPGGFNQKAWVVPSDVSNARPEAQRKTFQTTLLVKADAYYQGLQPALYPHPSPNLV